MVSKTIITVVNPIITRCTKCMALCHNLLSVYKTVAHKLIVIKRGATIINEINQILTECPIIAVLH